MNLTHSSKAALGVLLAVSLLTAGTAAALTVSADPPEAAEVGQQVSMSITIEQPFEDAPDQWTLRGESGLENPSWTVTTLEQGRNVATNEYGQATFEQNLDIENGATEVQIEVEGTAPEISQYSYDDIEVENVTVATVGRATDGTLNEIQTWDVHRYTEGSREARQAIADAEAAVAEASSQEARGILDDAKAFYSNEEWERAVSNAQQAQQTAEQASSGLPLVPIAIGVVVVLVLVGGGLYYRKQRQSGYKLQ
jgi:hypothetical protein